MPGERVLGGTYKLLHTLCSGAMGTLFVAEHLRLHRRVAVKLLSPQREARPELIARFRQEAEIISLLEHPHIVTVLDFDVTADGEPYLVLELLHGETLEKRLERERRLPLADVVRITTQLASALSALHDASIVHRDLKPANVFLTDSPGEPAFVKLLDFGISKNLRSERHITQERMLLGTPEYMAPEQAIARNDLIDHRTDQHALAVLAYEMLTGRQPFDHQDLDQVLLRVAGLEPTPASSLVSWVPVELDGVLGRALSKRPAARFDSVSAFAGEFVAAAGASVAQSSLALEARTPRSRVGAVDTLLSAERDTVSAARCLDRVRVSLRAGSLAQAALHAEEALRVADNSADRAAAAEVAASEPLLARVLMQWIGSPARHLYTGGHPTSESFPASPRAAFLWSRIDDGMTVEDLLDVAWMPRLQALRWLVQLVACGSVRLGNLGIPRRLR